MKIQTIALAEAANVSSDGKQNILGAGVRVVRAPAVPFSRPLTLWVAGEAPNDERDPVPVKITMKGSRGKETLLETTATFQDSPAVDERLPLTLNIRLQLADFVFHEFGTYDIVVRLGASRAVWRFTVDPVTESIPTPG